MKKAKSRRAETQPLQLRRPFDTTDFAAEDTTVPGVHRPEADRYNVESHRTDTRATMRIPLDAVPDDIGVDGEAYDFLIYEYGGSQ